MAYELMLELLKLDLGITMRAQDTYLLSRLKAAEQGLIEMGIALQKDDARDQDLVVSYAAYRYRSRANPDFTMPQSLNWDINNRIFSQKGKTS